jgi:hypothetical protein
MGEGIELHQAQAYELIHQLAKWLSRARHSVRSDEGIQLIILGRPRQ